MLLTASFPGPRPASHVKKCTRPSPAFPYCKRWEAGRGPGNEAMLHMFQPIPGLINYTGVVGREGLLSHARNAVASV